jgi:sigma-B regulation protein RsbU (phosphoserine phosphatase)
VIASLVLVNAHLFAAKWRSVTPALAWSMIVFGVLVAANNLGFGRAPLALEPIGFLVLIFGLAYTAAQRAIARDKKFVAVASELATARRIQTSILPRSLPELPGLRLAALYRPMTEVAGDFYDFIRLDDQHLTILIADVSGHGVPAALIASMLKVAFAQQAPHAADPAAVLTGLNQILSGVVDGQFVTAACAHVDLAGGVIAYAGAGHPPALLRRASGQIVELAENGLFLGPFRNAKYQNISAPFQHGDSLLLYTDGIVEATLADGEPFGDERLREFFAARGAAEPAGTADALMNAVARTEQEDDLTVVIAAA